MVINALVINSYIAIAIIFCCNAAVTLYTSVSVNCVQNDDSIGHHVWNATIESYFTLFLVYLICFHLWILVLDETTRQLVSNKHHIK